jgi:hypothetical protein
VFEKRGEIPENEFGPMLPLGPKLLTFQGSHKATLPAFRELTGGILEFGRQPKINSSRQLNRTAQQATCEFF